MNELRLCTAASPPPPECTFAGAAGLARRVRWGELAIDQPDGFAPDSVDSDDAGDDLNVDDDVGYGFGV